MESIINTVATKDDIANVKDGIANVCKEIGESKADIIKWMFILWMASVCYTGYRVTFPEKIDIAL